MVKNIALISEHASPLALAGGVDTGGQNIYVAHTARHLAALGYNVDVFTRRDNPDLAEVMRLGPRVRLVHVPAGPARYVRKEDLLPYMAEFAAYVVEFARRQQSIGAGYDMTHAHFFMSGLVALRVKRDLGVPYVVTFHALGRVRLRHQPNDQFPLERLGIEQLVIDGSEGIVAECPQDREDLITLYKAPPARITTIPCGFDPAELWPVDKAAARERLGLAPEEPVILQLGRMVPRKGVDTVIEALAQLRDAHGIRARLLIVGGESEEPDPVRTPEIGRLQAIAEHTGVADMVTFAGRRDRSELKYYYSAADVFVTVPWYEPFGITPVEAMACGTPVIGARVGGVKYSVLDGRTGFLVEPRDPRALARRLAHFYSEPSIAKVLSRHARRRANDLFTWRRVSIAIAALYEQVAVRRAAAVRRGGTPRVASVPNVSQMQPRA
jgi:glycosyltransferase involved in cell wall biosynthesis